MLPSPNYTTHTKPQFQYSFIILIFSSSLTLSSIYIIPFHQLLSLKLPTPTNCTHLHAQASTGTQHSLYHNEHSLCAVIYVAWRLASRRQAVHQFWVFSEFPAHEAQLVFLPLRILITRKSKYNHRPNKFQYLITMTHYYYNPISQ